MITDDIRAKATQIAEKYGLPVRLVMAIITVESGGNPFAIRYEPAFFSRYVRDNPSVKAKAPCSLDTERQARATSWGLMQVMGETARSVGFQGVFLSELTRVEAGIDAGCRYLRSLVNRYLSMHGWPGVVAAYNAGSPRMDGKQFANQSYVDKVLKACGGVWP